MNLQTGQLRRIGLSLLLLILLPAIFQAFFRYRNMRAGDTTWRIDRLTQQACRTSAVPVMCMPPAPFFGARDYVGAGIGVGDSEGVGVGP
ncbi:MAG TPA: hypothetical protein VN909_03265 [Candidatus Dormibacteraeota bacterium]|nr:hypothetical protein [Candidatus Dormibacteraeota bacterium]